MSKKGAFSTLPEVEYRSTLGNAYRVGGDSAAEYLLHPVFLQFAVLCLALLVLLDQSSDMAPSLVWQVPLIWLATASTALLAGIVLVRLLSSLPRRMGRRRRYTPLILLPVVAVAELVRVVLSVGLQAGDWPPLPEVMAGFARIAVIALILDVMHALYVVPLHPLARVVGNSDSGPLPTPDMPLPDTAQLATDSRAIPDLTIGDRRYAQDDILWIRTEDHYLHVVSVGGSSRLRAKLSDLQALQDGRIGMQVNRSQWVAFAAITEIREEANGQITLRLVTGDDATLARSRRIMFRQMMQAWRQRQDQ